MTGTTAPEGNGEGDLRNASMDESSLSPSWISHRRVIGRGSSLSSGTGNSFASTVGRNEEKRSKSFARLTHPSFSSFLSPFFRSSRSRDGGLSVRESERENRRHTLPFDISRRVSDEESIQRFASGDPEVGHLVDRYSDFFSD